MKKTFLLGFWALIAVLSAVTAPKALAYENFSRAGYYGGGYGGRHNDGGAVLAGVFAGVLIEAAIDHSLRCDQMGYGYCDYYDHSGCYYQQASEPVMTVCEQRGYYGGYSCVTENHVVYLQSCNNVQFYERY